ncbi:MAG TPA: hypothetical protein VFL90_11090 [Methylomirabilota bacterium]|nr:hypothetical protein [Methylomirabilota bacterium]
MDSATHHDLLVVVTFWACVHLMTIIIVGVIARRTLTQSRRLAAALAKLIVQESEKIRRQRP